MLIEADIQPNQPYKLTIADFELLAEAGAFRDNERVELIDGKIIIMSPAYRRHYRAHTQMLVRLANVVEQLDQDLEVNGAPSVAIPPYSEPLPDIVVSAKPQSEKGIEIEAVRLIVEVSDSTTRYDLNTKARLYAEAQVPEYWVVNMSRNLVHQFWQPLEGTYAQSTEASLGATLRSVTIPGLAIETADLI